MMDLQNFDLGGAPANTESAGAGASAAPDLGGLTFNLNDVEEPSFEVLPKGVYKAVVESFELTNSQSSGAPMISAIYTVTEGEYAERKLYDYLVLAGNAAKYALPRLKQILVRVCPDVSIDNLDVQKFVDSATIVGRACQVQVAITTQKTGDYKGEKRNQIREVLAAADTNSFIG